MKPITKFPLLAMLLIAVALCVQSCTEQGVQLEKHKVQFRLDPASTDAKAVDIDLPENSKAIISITSSNGAPVLTDFEITVVQSDGVYVTDPIELGSGVYRVTDFMVVSDNEDLYVTPKSGAEVTTSPADALPYNFSLDESDVATVNMRIHDVRNEDLHKFGYHPKRRHNSISIEVYNSTGPRPTSATAELRQNKKLLKVFSLNAGVNNLNLGGDQKLPYTLTVYTANSAKTRTFDLKQLKKEIGKNPLRLRLEPALVFTLHSQDDAGDYDFDLSMSGSGTVNINWGDGSESPATLPFTIPHKYFTGNYTAIVTGNINQVTDFFGFSYLTIIHSITGLTNLTSLKTYNPSWGAVPIKVDLSNCKQLETISIAKYGAPYEPCDLRTEFKLPTEHYINSFTMDAPTFDINREFMSEEELDAIFSKIYNNAVNRNIQNGQFLIYPVSAPAPATQQKIDILQNDYNWTVVLNDIYDFEGGRSRSTLDLNARREQWLRERFSNGEEIIKRAKRVPELFVKVK